MGILSNASSISIEQANSEFGFLLVDGEQIQLSFKMIRDVVLITNKRIVLVNKQGLTGKKTEFKSILYKTVTKFSIETAGGLDMDSELKIWIGSELKPSVDQKFFKNSIDIKEVQRVVAQNVLK